MGLIISTDALSPNSTLNESIRPDSVAPHEYPSQTMLFLVLCVLTGATVRCLLKSYKISYTVSLFIIGVFFGFLSGRFQYFNQLTSFTRINPHLLLRIFLPILLFNSAFSLDAHTFKHGLYQCLLLSGPGVVFCTGITALFSKYLYWQYEWTWPVALMFGAILSPTDPVAVVALLRDIGAPTELTTLIEGESLLNDGSGIVLYDIFLRLTEYPDSMSGSFAILYITQLTLLGPICGYVIGKTIAFCLSIVNNDAIGETAFTIAAAYGTYYVAEVILNTSGVLATTTMGLILSEQKSSISPEAIRKVEQFWSLLSYLAETMIFLTVGIVISEQGSKTIDTGDWLLIFYSYVGTILIRALMVAVFSPILIKIGYGLPFKYAVLLVWSGLRGAVGLALSLAMAKDWHRATNQPGQKIFLHLSGVVFLTLLINAQTLKPLLKLTGMTRVTLITRVSMAKAVFFLRRVIEKSIQTQRVDYLTSNANFNWIAKRTSIRDPYANEKLPDDVTKEDITRVVEKCGLSKRHDAVTTDLEKTIWNLEIRERLIKAERVWLERLFDRGLLERRAFKILVNLNKIASDNEERGIDVEELMKAMKPSLMFRSMRRVFSIFFAKIRLDHQHHGSLLLNIEEEEDNEEIVDAQIEKSIGIRPFRHLAWKYVSHCFPRTIKAFCLISSSSIVLYELQMMIQLGRIEVENRHTMEILQWCCLCYFIFHVLLKLYAIGWDMFWLKCWNRFDLLSFPIIGLNLIALVVAIHDGTKAAFFYVIFAKCIMLLRFFRLCSLIRPIGKLLIRIFRSYYHSGIFTAYDIGHGFLLIQNKIENKLSDFLPQGDIFDRVRSMLIEKRLAIMREMVEIQKFHPEIVVAAKTRYAARKVLNDAKEVLELLAEECLLGEREYALLLTKINKEIQTLVKSPYMIPSNVKPDELIRKISWLVDKKVHRFLLQHMTVEKYGTGTRVTEIGDLHNGLMIIISGVVKVQGTVIPNECEIIQNVDTPKYFGGSEENILDFLSTGNILGKIGTLTRKPCLTKASCETEVTVVKIPFSAIQEAIRQFHTPPSLLYQLWRNVAIQIAFKILQDTPEFREIDAGTIRLQLQSALIPNLKNSCCFLINDHVKHIVLIQGKAKAADSDQLFYCPSYIRVTRGKIVFPDYPRNRIRPVLLVLAQDGCVLPPRLDWSGASKVESNDEHCDQHKGRFACVIQSCEDNSCWQAPSASTQTFVELPEPDINTERRNLRNISDISL